MGQCRADPCVYKKTVEGVGKLILVVHVDEEACDKLYNTLNGNSPSRKSRGVEVVPGVRCGARLATGQYSNQTTSDDRTSLSCNPTRTKSL